MRLLINEIDHDDNKRDDDWQMSLRRFSAIQSVRGWISVA